MSTTTRELRVESWAAYFDAIASVGGARSAAVEVLNRQAGDRPGVAPYPLRAIGYDPVQAVLEVTVVGRYNDRDRGVLRHFISDPRRISVEESGPLNPKAILVKDASGTRTRIEIVDRSSCRPQRRVRGTERPTRRAQQRLRDHTSHVSGSCG
jgi:Family of unknown function (DUF5335)